MAATAPTLSLIIPIYNEEAVIAELGRRLADLLAALPFECEIICVDDGSHDGSLGLLRDLAARDPRYRILSFSRNFGHQAAVTAGIDHARGEAVVIMDGDLQDPPEVVREMVEKWQAGYDVVYGRRRSRTGETFFKRATAKLFYRLFRKLIPVDVPLDTGDFRLMSRRIVVAFRELREVHRFVRGMIAWLGFRQTEVVFDRPGRFAGETKFSLGRMIRFALDGITSFSVMPLRMATYLGFFAGLASIVVATWAAVAHIAFDATVPGWTTIVIVATLLASVQLVMIGILGEYVGRIYEQVKARPIYLIAEDSAARSATNEP